MSVESPGAPVLGTQTFGGLVKATSGDVKILLASGGLIIKGKVVASPEDPAQLMAEITVATDEAGTQYCAMSLFGGNIVEINPADGDVTVFSYDAGCDQPGGPFFQGGISFSLAKPSGLRAMNGIMGCGVGVLGADAVFTGQVTW
jgi:hypothetical protein